jgi:hypothetical protein
MSSDTHSQGDPEQRLKLALLVTKSGPIVIATSHKSFTDQQLIQKLRAKGIDKFIAYPLRWELAKKRYGGHFEVALQDLREQDDLRVLDFDGDHAFGLFHLSELGAPVMCEVNRDEGPRAAHSRFRLPSRILPLNAAEIVDLVRVETSNVETAQDFYVSALKEYLVEEEFDRKAYGIKNDADYDLVTGLATLTFEPYRGLNSWTLTVTVESPLGPLKQQEEASLDRRELTLDEFEREMTAPGKKRITVRLDRETPLAKEEFHHWLVEARARRLGQAVSAA